MKDPSAPLAEDIDRQRLSTPPIRSSRLSTPPIRSSRLSAPPIRSSRLSKLIAILRGDGSPARLGFSVAVGLFVGCLPLYGLHLPLCLLLCLPFRLDAVVAYLAANISNPLLAPLILFAEVELGSRLIQGKWIEFSLEAARHTGVAGFAVEAAYGSVILGAMLALVFGTLAATVARHRSRRSPVALARARTCARYADASAADRYYVASKLCTDPVVGQLCALGELGEILDAGCGRGQLGLFLLDYGIARSVSGFDFDARKVWVAERAGASSASFSVADLRSAPSFDCETVLLIDVLHYLPATEQARVLAWAASCVREHGRVIVREADPNRGLRSHLTRAFERVATAIGYNRTASTLRFRPLNEIVEELTKLGFACRTLPAKGLLSNALVVATKRPRERSGGQ